MDKKDAIKIINKIFNDLHIPYALIGSYAVAVWGIPRATKDIDFIADIPSEKLQTVIQEFQSANFQAEIHSGDIDDPLKSLIKLTYKDNNTLETIDILLGIKKISSQEIYAHTTKLSFFNSIIPVIAPEDLIITKLLAASPLDIQDVKNILNVMKDKINISYINNFCKKNKIKLPL